MSGPSNCVSIKYVLDGRLNFRRTLVPLTADQTAALWKPIVGYAAAIDQKRFEDLYEVFHPEFCADYEGARFEGPTPVVDRMAALHDHLSGSLHRLSNFRCLTWDGSSATTETYVDAVLAGGPAAQGRTYRDLGIYTDLFEPFEGSWRIRQRIYRRVWSEGHVGDLQPLGSAGAALAAGASLTQAPDASAAEVDHG